MDEELILRAKRIAADRTISDDGRRGPLFGAVLRCNDIDWFAPSIVAESMRSLVETIAVLEARIERLEKQ